MTTEERWNEMVKRSIQTNAFRLSPEDLAKIYGVKVKKVREIQAEK